MRMLACRLLIMSEASQNILAMPAYQSQRQLTMHLPGGVIVPCVLQIHLRRP